MKIRKFAFICLFVLSISAPLSAESSPGAQTEESAELLLKDRTWTLQVDPLTTILGFVHLQVERRLADSLSIYVGPHLRLFSSPFGEQEDFQGYGAEVGLRWFVFRDAPEGWWAQVRGVGAYLTTADATAPGGYASVLGGYTHIFGSGLVLSGGLGVQYIHYTIENLGPSLWAPALHTTLGWAF